MASIEKRGEGFRVVFYLRQKSADGKERSQKYSESIDADDELAADKIKDRVDDFLSDIRKGRVKIPAGADVGRFVVTEGRLAEAPAPEATYPLESLYEEYRKTLPEGSVEESTLTTTRIHLAHLARLLGPKTQLGHLDLESLQAYVNLRLKEKNKQKKPISPVTVRKEIATLSCMWSWAHARRKIKGMFPGKGLRFGKTTEQGRFQTFAEIQRQINRGGAEELWDCLYLRVKEIDEFLTYMREHSTYPYLYPFLVTAAYTGARRSELLRSEVSDIDFELKTITFRERKRDKERHTLRTVPMETQLVKILKTWLGERENGYTFTWRDTQVPPLKAQKHLRRTLAGSKWDVVRGFHVLRHSAASNMASAGVDQRTIDAIMGHQTEAMAKRYRHCFPQDKKNALARVFGKR